MTIVIDIGCARYGGDYSIERLIERFRPDVIYGFDPNPEGLFEAAMSADQREGRSVRVCLDNRAAWTFDGEIGFRADGLNSWVTSDPGAEKVVCFDLARFIGELEGESIVLKLDAEGAEYDLLPHLIATGTDELLSLASVEWHVRGIEDAEGRRRAIEAGIRCPLEEWPY